MAERWEFRTDLPLGLADILLAMKDILLRSADILLAIEDILLMAADTVLMLADILLTMKDILLSASDTVLVLADILLMGLESVGMARGEALPGTAPRHCSGAVQAWAASSGRASTVSEQPLWQPPGMGPSSTCTVLWWM